MLGRGLLVATSNHEAHVDVVVHVVVRHGGPQCVGHLVASHAHINAGGSQSGEQSVQVAVQECEAAVVESQPLPDPITNQESTVEHRHLRLVARQELAVDPDLDSGVALVSQGLVGAAGFGPRSGLGHPRSVARLVGFAGSGLWRVDGGVLLFGRPFADEA